VPACPSSPTSPKWVTTGAWRAAKSETADEGMQRRAVGERDHGLGPRQKAAPIEPAHDARQAIAAARADHPAAAGPSSAACSSASRASSLAGEKAAALEDALGVGQRIARRQFLGSTRKRSRGTGPDGATTATVSPRRTRGTASRERGLAAAAALAAIVAVGRRLLSPPSLSSGSASSWSCSSLTLMACWTALGAGFGGSSFGSASPDHHMPTRPVSAMRATFAGLGGPPSSSTDTALPTGSGASQGTKNPPASARPSTDVGDGDAVHRSDRGRP